MGKAIDFAERNDFIGKPESMTDNQCYGLPVSRFITMIPGETEKSDPVLSLAHVICWQLSEEERIEVARTGLVYVKMIGATTYPLSVHGALPIYTDAGKMSDTLLTDEEIRKAKGL